MAQFPRMRSWTVWKGESGLSTSSHSSLLAGCEYNAKASMWINGIDYKDKFSQIKTSDFLQDGGKNGLSTNGAEKNNIHV